MVGFSVADQGIEAAIVEPGAEVPPDLVDNFIIGIHEEMDTEGNRHRQFMRYTAQN